MPPIIGPINFVASGLIAIVALATTLTRAAEPPASQASVDSSHTGDLVWDGWSDAQAQWIEAFTAILVKSRPALRPVAEWLADLRSAKLRRQAFRVKYLLAHHPERMVRNQGLWAFVEPEWSHKDELTLLGAEPTYEALIQRIETLERSDARSEKAGEAYKYVEDELPHNEEFKGIRAEYDQEIARLEQSLRDQISERGSEP